MKPFLLTMGKEYYPESGDGDWIKCYETLEDAEKDVVHIKPGRYSFGYYVYKPSCPNEQYHDIMCVHYDWYEIIDLREWGVFDESE